MHGLLRCNNKTGVRACTQSRRVTRRCHNSPGWETGVTEWGWCHAPEARGGFSEILKKSVSWDETCLGERRLVFACSQRPLWWVPHVLGGADEKTRIERLCLSLSLCWKTFKLKGNKKLRTWTEKLLRVFRILRFLCSVLYIYEHYMSISHMAVSGYGTMSLYWETHLLNKNEFRLIKIKISNTQKSNVTDKYCFLEKTSPYCQKNLWRIWQKSDSILRDTAVIREASINLKS